MPRGKSKHQPPWREVAKPHPDIIRGRFELAVFAANIYEVAQHRGMPDYSDPERFFQRTYVTQGLKELSVAVFRRLAAKPGGEAVVDLMTSFGGGKTHALVALYHLAQGGPSARDWPGVPEILEAADLEAPPLARVVVLSGEDINPVQGVKGKPGDPVRKTLWGELSWQLGGQASFALVRANDEKRIAPSTEDLAELIEGGKPTLILVDEALQYISRARGEKVHDTNLAAQSFNFFKALTEAVARTPNACLVMTLPASIMTEVNREDEEDYQHLSHLFKRLERTRRLAEGDEIYEIVRRRLFQDVGSEADRTQVISAYLNYYRQNENAFPQAVATNAYLKKMERAYPFHPELLDALNERWSSLPNFQRTRGVLRMLALLISDLYRDDPLPLIHLSSVRLSNPDFRSEVLSQIDARQFDAVLESDVTGTGARAAQVDAEGSDIHQREHLAERTATAIFFYSFGGAVGISTATLPQLRLAVLRPGIEPEFIPGVLEELKRRLYYLEAEGGQYRFTVTPNLNAIRVDQENTLELTEVEDLLKSEILKQARGSKFHLAPFPEGPEAVGAGPGLALVVLPPSGTWGKTTKEETQKFVQKIIDGGTTHRSHRNTLVFLVAEEGNRMAAEARTKLALDKVERIYGRAGKLSKAHADELEKMQEESRKSLIQSIWSSYRFILTPGEGGVARPLDLGRQIHREGRTLQDEVWDLLVDKERLAPRLGPTQLVGEALGLWPKDQGAFPMRMLREAFSQYTYLPMVPDISVLRSMVADGVRDGIFGYGLGDGKRFDVVHFRKALDPQAVDFVDGAWLVRPELVPIQPPEGGGGGGPAGLGVEPGAGPGGVGGGPEPQPRAPGAYRTLVIEGDLDWKKWADFYDEVLKPLINAGANIQVHIRMNAASDSGIPRNLVEITVNENIIQRGLGVRVSSTSEDKEKSGQ